MNCCVSDVVCDDLSDVACGGVSDVVSMVCLVVNVDLRYNDWLYAFEGFWWLTDGRINKQSIKQTFVLL